MLVMMLDKHKGQRALSELIFISVSNLNTIDTDHLILCYGGILGDDSVQGIV